MGWSGISRISLLCLVCLGSRGGVAWRGWGVRRERGCCATVYVDVCVWICTGRPYRRYIALFSRCGDVLVLDVVVVAKKGNGMGKRGGRGKV